MAEANRLAAALRYQLDAGKGTSNFVVFDPAHMNIIGRE